MVRALGATPVEGREGPVDVALRAVCPEGVDAALDGLGGDSITQCIRATRKGGVVVAYGFSGTMKDGKTDNLAVGLGMASLFAGAFLRGRRGTFYGITALYRDDPKPFREDLPKLFTMLAEGRLRPLIAARLPLLAARDAAVMLERGGFQGKIVHLASLGVTRGEVVAPRVVRHDRRHGRRSGDPPLDVLRRLPRAGASDRPAARVARRSGVRHGGWDAASRGPRHRSGE